MLEQINELSQRLIRLYQRPFHRYLGNEAPFDSRSTLVIGQRGVGKTTLLVQYLAAEESNGGKAVKVLYVPCDHYVVAEVDLYDLAEEFVQMGGKVFCLDEVHRRSEWPAIVKSVTDTFPDLKVLCSGSSLLEVERASHDLSRRVVIRELFGLSFREYLSLQTGCEFPVLTLPSILHGHTELAQRIVDALAQQDLKVLTLFKAFLKDGYYPYRNEFSSFDDFARTLQQNVDRTLEGDLLAAFPRLSGVAVRKIRQLLTIISRSSPFTPNLKKLGSLVDVGDERTLKEYLNYLERGRLIRLLSAQGSLASAMSKPEKIFVDNCTLLNALAPRAAVEIGTMRETFFLSALSPRHTLSAPRFGDFAVDEKFIFEIGGKKKSFNQLRNIQDSFLAVDDIEVSHGARIPLWLFGLLY